MKSVRLKGEGLNLDIWKSNTSTNILFIALQPSKYITQSQHIFESYSGNIRMIKTEISNTTDERHLL